MYLSKVLPVVGNHHPFPFRSEGKLVLVPFAAIPGVEGVDDQEARGFEHPLDGILDILIQIDYREVWPRGFGVHGGLRLRELRAPILFNQLVNFCGMLLVVVQGGVNLVRREVWVRSSQTLPVSQAGYCFDEVMY